MVGLDKMRFLVSGFAVVRTTMMMMLRMVGLFPSVSKRPILSANEVEGPLVLVWGSKEE